MAETKTKLTAELLEKARKELNEDQSKVSDQIQSLREKIQDDPNLNFKTDDAFLLKFLRARKFDQGRTLQLMTNYYKQRVNYPELFSKTTAEVEEAMKAHIVFALQDRDDKGRAVALFNFQRWNPNEISFDVLIYSLLMLMEYLSEDESVQINGCVFVVDLAGLSLSHVSSLTPRNLKESATVIMNSFPMRYQAVHYVNESPLFDGVFVIIKPLLSKKLQERIMFHGNCYASLHDHVNPEILPEELGGDIDPFDFEYWADRVVKHSQIMAESVSKYGFVDTKSIKEEKDQERDYDD